MRAFGSFITGVIIGLCIWHIYTLNCKIFELERNAERQMIEYNMIKQAVQTNSEIIIMLSNGQMQRSKFDLSEKIPDRI